MSCPLRKEEGVQSPTKWQLSGIFPKIQELARFMQIDL
jgi:hypothetical protein